MWEREAGKSRLTYRYDGSRKAVLMNVRCRFTRKWLAQFLILAAASAVFLGLFGGQARAVTFGDNINEPSEQAPWVVSIWVSPTDDADQISYGCTGTLITSDVVLTAAHCVFENGNYFIKYGATTLAEEVDLIPASNVWAHPRYNPTKFANDIGLIKLSEPVSLPNFPTLGNNAISKLVNARSRFTLFGWGRNQNDRSPELLGTTRLLNLDRMAVKEYGNAFNANIMLGAGLYIAREKVWAGACSGDSGGPLLMRAAGKDYIVGVTSWGARDCDTSKPSVFARVTYYESDIKKGIKDLTSINRIVNRAVPVNSKKPTITGKVAPGGTLQCNTGSWKNSLDVTFSWSSPSRLLNSTNESVTVLNSDVGETFACDVIASGKSGSIRRTVSIALPSEPRIVGNVAISGISAERPFIGGEELSCDGFTWGGTFDATSQEWHVVKDPKNPALSAGTLLGKNSTFKVTGEFLEKNEGNYILCAISASNKGFAVGKTIARVLDKGVVPEIKNLRISVEKNFAGAQALCAFDGARDGSTTNFQWSYGNGEEIPNGRSSILRISEDIAEKSQTVDLDCSVSLSNALGVAKKSVRADKNEIAKLVTPVYQIRPTANWAVGSQAFCEKTFGLTQSNSEIIWGVMASPTAMSFTKVLANGNVIQISQSMAEQIAGETIGCSVLVSDRGALTRKYFSIDVPTSAAPLLPTPAAPTVALQDPSNKTVKVTLAIGPVANFNPSTMQLKLIAPGTSCDNTIIESTPNQVLCANLAGNTDYSASLQVSYRNNRIPQSNTSSITTFKSDALISLTEAPERVSAEQKEGGAVAYFGDQVDCPTDKSSRKIFELSPSRSSYTVCWPTDALAAWEAGGRTWTNFLVRKKFNAPIPPAPILLEQIMATDFSGGLSLKFSVPEIPGFNRDTMGLELSVVGTNVSGSGPSPLPGTTVTVTMIGPELDYTATLMIWCKSSCAPNQTRLELFGPGLKFKTIKNTWVPTDVDPPVVTAWAPYSADDYRGVMPSSGPTGTGVGVRYKITDDVEIASGSVRFITSGGQVIAQGASALIGGSNRDAHYFAKIVIPQGSVVLATTLTIQANATDKSGKTSAWVNVGTFTIAADIPDYPTINVSGIASPITPLALSGTGGQGRIGSTITFTYNTYASRGASDAHEIKLVGGGQEILLTRTLRQIAGALRATWQGTFVVPTSVVVGATYSVQAQITDYYDYKSLWTEIGRLVILPPYTP